MKSPVRLAFGSTLKPNENVRIQAFEVTADRAGRMLQRLLAKESGTRAGVWFPHKTRNGKAGEEFVREGFKAAMIHGEPFAITKKCGAGGFQQGRFRVLVATDVASRGIHVQDIAL